MNKILKWALMNFGVVALFFWGYYEPNSGILTLSLTLFWITAVTAIMFGFSEDVAHAMLKKDPDFEPSVSKEVDIIFDTAVTIMLAYYDYSVLAVFYLIHMLALNTLRENLNRFRVDKSPVNNDSDLTNSKPTN